MTKKHLPKSSVSATGRLGRALPLEQALRAVDARRHGGELMAGPPMGSEALPAASNYEADELLAKATGVFGGREAAERWMVSNVMGLDGQRPIDLLLTQTGAQLVDDFLTRLEYGVYT